MAHIQSFTDLVAWQKSHQLALRIYKVTQKFPNEERFGLSNQLCRAIVSVTSNIAEGFGRSSAKEKSQFYAMSYGSLLEVQSQLLLARDLKYLNDNDFKILPNAAVECAKLLSGLRTANKRKEF